MKNKSPRIYTYKITFEEVPHYYYGYHKEDKFDEYYMGSPYTHKWMWDFYTPQKQVLELFDFSDKGYIEASEVEKRLINPVYKTDPLCLNENCGGIISLDARRRGGKLAGKTTGKINGHKTYENKTGIHGMSYEQRMGAVKRGGQATSSQKWQCTVTGFITSAANLSRYQKARGIDTSNRIRLQ
jgi:hypothetical protein